MRKKLFAVFLAAVVAAFAGYNIYQTQRIETMSDLMLANVEALANSEIKPGDSCYSDAKYDADKPKAVKCGTPCVYEPLDIPWFASTSYCS